MQRGGQGKKKRAKKRDEGGERKIKSKAVE